MGVDGCKGLSQIFFQIFYHPGSIKIEAFLADVFVYNPFWMIVGDAVFAFFSEILCGEWICDEGFFVFFGWLDYC